MRLGQKIKINGGFSSVLIKVYEIAIKAYTIIIRGFPNDKIHNSNCNLYTQGLTTNKFYNHCRQSNFCTLSMYSFHPDDNVYNKMINFLNRYILTESSRKFLLLSFISVQLYTQFVCL